MYYLYVLKQKDSTDYTGLEFEIDRQVGLDEIDWFPSFGEGDAEEALKNCFTSLEAEMNYIFETMEDSANKLLPTLEDSRNILTSQG